MEHIDTYKVGYSSAVHACMLLATLVTDLWDTTERSTPAYVNDIIMEIHKVTGTMAGNGVSEDTIIRFMRVHPTMV